MINKQAPCITYGILILLMAAFIPVSCKKTNSSYANVLFYNGSWSSAAITAAWNGNNIITTPINQGQSSGTSASPYLPVPAGTNLVTIKAGTTVLADKNIYASSSTGSSLLFYDTSAAAGSGVNIMQLTDDPTPPDTAAIKYRFIDLAPDTAVTADVWLVNGITDSVQLGARIAFIGKTPVASSIQVFTTIKYHGEAYTIKIKRTGTEELYTSVPGYVFTVKGIYTIIFSGLLTGTADTGFKLSVLHHIVP